MKRPWIDQIRKIAQDEPGGILDNHRTIIQLCEYIEHIEGENAELKSENERLERLGPIIEIALLDGARLEKRVKELEARLILSRSREGD